MLSPEEIESGLFVTHKATGLRYSVVDSENEEDQETLKRRDELLTKRFDAANEEKFMLGEQWNQQVRAYNAAKSE